MIERYVMASALQIHGMVVAMEPKIKQISSALTDEAVRNGSIKKVEKRGNVGETSKDKNGTWPKCTICNSYHAPEGPCRTCFNYNRPGHLAKDFRGVPRNVNPVNARNPTVRACYKCSSTDHVRCKLYDEFDNFTYKKGETLHEYYLRFTLLLNDMNIYKMPLEQFQVNTKFLNTLPDEWSKFVTDVKLVKDLHTTNVDQLHAHLQQHERHAIEVR
ncbi:hypothetical protein Tco_0466552 [Tanacetum coccineum]